MRSAPLSAIVLAAGDGRRMRSTRPKPLHVLCGRTMLHYVLDSLSECKLERVVVVVGSTGDQVEKKLRDQSAVHYIEYVEQARRDAHGGLAFGARPQHQREQVDVGQAPHSVEQRLLTEVRLRLGRGQYDRCLHERKGARTMPARSRPLRR